MFVSSHDGELLPALRPGGGGVSTQVSHTAPEESRKQKVTLMYLI